MKGLVPRNAPGYHERCNEVFDELAQDVDIYVDPLLADESSDNGEQT